MSHESPSPEKPAHVGEDMEAQERVRLAVEKLVELIEREPGIDWLAHQYTNYGYKDLHYDKRQGAFVPKQDDQDRIPIESMGEEVRRAPFKFYAKVFRSPRQGYKQIVFWMNLGGERFEDGNPFLSDPRGSYFASALQILDSPEQLEKLGDENLKRYLDSFLHGTPDAEARTFMSAVLEACNTKWQPDYWRWIESLEK